jgi:hypothetical protein
MNFYKLFNYFKFLKTTKIPKMRPNKYTYLGIGMLILVIILSIAFSMFFTVDGFREGIVGSRDDKFKKIVTVKDNEKKLEEFDEKLSNIEKTEREKRKIEKEKEEKELTEIVPTPTETVPTETVENSVVNQEPAESTQNEE